MKRRRGGAKKNWTAPVAIACLALGALGGWNLHARSPEQNSFGLPAISRPAGADLDRMSAADLRREVRILRATIDQKDREIAELQINLTIATKTATGK
ncbi:hypothetical protein LLG95_17340 [bacterium]|nr:hypothetical protein [bacterium]